MSSKKIAKSSKTRPTVGTTLQEVYQLSESDQLSYFEEKTLSRLTPVTIMWHTTHESVMIKAIDCNFHSYVIQNSNITYNAFKYATKDSKDPEYVNRIMLKWLLTGNIY